MANAVYPKGKEKFLAADVDLLVDTIKAALVDTGTYTYNSTHEFYSSVSTAVVGTPQTIANPSVTNGVFDGDDVTYSALSGSTVEAIVIYKDTGNAATSPLIAYIDNAGALAITPNGGDVTINWNASGIIALTDPA